MKYWLLYILAAAGCDQVFGLDRPLPLDGALDGDTRGSDALPVDASIIGASTIDASTIDASTIDASVIDAPIDAFVFVCTAHNQCSAMTSGTCCVNPGPTGHCETGIVIGGVCSPQ